jgi:predicted enzyme related to lactoylglutathione lyase
MWVGYVGVADVDQTAQAIAASSGTVHKEPWDIPNVGRVAMVADPQGAMFALFKLAGAPPEPPPGGTPGHGGWRELHARDWQAAFGFYAPLFGWNKLQAVDMGPMGTYQLFGQGETQIGGMFNGAQAGQGASWLYYFNVESVDAAAARVGEAGGTRLMDIQQVPGGSWVVPCLDPQGARFAIVGPR